MQHKNLTPDEAKAKLVELKNKQADMEAELKELTEAKRKIDYETVNLELFIKSLNK